MRKLEAKPYIAVQRKDGLGAVRMVQAMALCAWYRQWCCAYGVENGAVRMVWRMVLCVCYLSICHCCCSR